MTQSDRMSCSKRNIYLLYSYLYQLLLSLFFIYIFFQGSGFLLK